MRMFSMKNFQYSWVLGMQYSSVLENKFDISH